MIRLDNLDEAVPVVCNTGDQAILDNMSYSCSLDLPWLQVEDAHDGVASIVAGGPSVKNFVGNMPGDIFAVNGTMKLLHEQGVKADYFILLDARPDNVDFIDCRNAKEYLISSQCHKNTLNNLDDVTLWHPNYPGVEEFVKDRECALIGGGTTVGLQAMGIAFAMGYREIHLYGFDSSYEDGEGHAYTQSFNDDDLTDVYYVGGVAFISTPWMVRQAMEFQAASRQLADGGAEITVHGTGLLPTMAQEMTKPALTVLTVYKSGGVFTPEYVRRLRDGVAENLTVPHRFVCMTDHPIDGVECIPLKYGMAGWWAKAEMFRPELPFGRVLYVDLSAVITGSLDDMATQDGIVITKDWYFGGPSQSVLLYTVGDFENVWDEFIKDPEHWSSIGDKMIAPDFGDQVLMNRIETPDMRYWQDVLPGHLVSYKVHGITDDCRMIKFHGSPKPHELNWLERLENVI